MDTVNSTTAQIFDKAKETVSFAHISTDIVIVFGVWALFFFYIVYRGREEGLANVFALLLSGLLLLLFPYWNEIGIIEELPFSLGYSTAGIFLILFIGIRYIMKKFISPGFGGLNIKTVLETLILSSALASLLLTFSFNLLKLNLHTFGIPLLAELFMTPQGTFFIVLYAIGSLIGIRRLQGY